MTRAEVFESIKESGIVPAIRPSNVNQALHAVEAIMKGGLFVIEISMTQPDALPSMQAVRKQFDGKILLGAGTVLDASDVQRAFAAGVQFIVTSGFDESAVRAAHSCEIPILAGALTPTEVQIAAATGADAVKIFPCYAVGGPQYIRSLCGQYPAVEFIASGGVSLENCSDYLRAGACAIGVGGEIGDSGSMASGDHRLFTERARRFRNAVTEARATWRGARPKLQRTAPQTALLN